MQNRMEGGGNAVLQEDLENIAASALPWETMRGSTVLITGATGLVGSQLARALLAANRVHGCGLRILALIRSAEKAQSVFGALAEREELSFVIGDVTALPEISGPVDYILHCAAQTASRELVTHPVEAIHTAVAGTDAILRLAREKQSRSVVYLSSMEMYGNPGLSEQRTDEEHLGQFALLKPRSCYPESKRLCENLCACYHAEYGVPVKIARLAQTFGAGVSREEGRVFAQFARAAIEGTDIVLHTRGRSFGNYCYTADAVCGILTILLRGENAQAYNVVNEAATMRIAEMAQLVAERIAGGRISVVFDIPESDTVYGYAQDVELRLSGARLRALGWEPIAAPDMETMYRRMIAGFC